MRAAHALLGAMVASLALSGCLDLFIGPPEPEPPQEAPPETWHVMAPPDIPPKSGVFGFWVPENTTGLRLSWPDLRPEGAAVPVPPGWDQGWPDYGPLHEMPPLAVVFAPDGHVLYAGNDEGDIVREDPPVPNAVFPTLYHDATPTPGLYRIALYGHQTPPVVEVHLGTDRWLSPMAPLPLVFERLHMSGSFPSGTLSGAGVTTTIEPPIGTVFVRPDITGAAVDAHLTVTNAEGADLAQMRTLLTRIPGAADVLFGFEPGQFSRYDQMEPAHLDAGPWEYTAQADGDAVAFLYLGVAPEIAAPKPRPLALASATWPDALESVPLAGAVDPWSAAWFDLPPDAAIILYRAGDSRPEAVPYRLYNTDGERVLWGLVGAQKQLLHPPSGSLLLVNDGGSTLDIDIVGAAPSDAAFHGAQIDRLVGSIHFDAATGHETVEASFLARGPVVQFSATPYAGFTQEMHVTLSNDQGPLLSLPTFDDYPPGRGGSCCNMPFFTFQSAMGHFLDGGAYTVRIDALEAQGELELLFYTVSLAGIDASAPA